MKLWQVQGKDLQEIRCEALSDEQRLQDWLLNDTRNDGQAGSIIAHAEPGLAAGGNTNSLQKLTPPPSRWMAFQETKARAEEGDAAAQAALGFMYELGIGAPVDCAEAVKWYREAAEQGNARAQFNLGQIASRGFMNEPGMNEPAGRGETVHWCRKAAEQGHARAQFNVGQMYEWGDSVPRDAAEALKWYRASAEQGDPAAEYKLGLCYCNGLGVTQKTGEAVYWWRRAAEQGEATSQYMLGLCYCNAQGVRQDYAKAVKWYLKAAEQGEAKAQAKLADAYYIGVGVATNLAAAVKWYREAAEQGDAAAQRHLGIMYGLGQGVPQDYTEAYKWCTLAAAQQDTNAVHNRKSIANSMTPSQIAEGQRLSQEFVARKGAGASNRGNGQLAAKAGSPVEARSPNPSQPVVAAGGDSILGINVLLVGRKVTTATGGCIDLLGIDGQANLVALELKRDKRPHEIVALTLDHASWVNHLSYEQIDAITQGFTGKSLCQAFHDHFGKAIPKSVNASPSMVIVASELDASSERVVQYLAKKHGVPIHVLRIALYKTASGEFLGRACA
jgi:TPR repeat protein